MSRIKSALGSAVLFAGTLICAFALFEAACRTIVDDGMHYHLEMWKYAVELKAVADDPAIGHRHQPGRSARLMGVEVHINELGLRDDPVDIGAETTRILMLGDSVTFGWGVPQEQTVSARLEISLADTLQRKVDVINSGVGNYNTAMEVAWFERDGVALEPDVVVLNLFINDAEPTPDYEPVRWWDSFLYSRVILFGGLDTIERTVFGGADWQSYYRDLYRDDAPGWQSMQAAVARLAERCRELGVPLVLVDYPELRELDPYPFDDVVALFEMLARINEVPFVSLLPAVRGDEPSSLWVTPPDPHPNAYAAGKLADHLSQRLIELDLGL